MALSVWPDDLPQSARLGGLAFTSADGRVTSSPDMAPPKIRRRYSSAVKPISALFVMTAEQRARCERFWDEDTAGGSLPFIMPDLVNNGAFLLTDLGEFTETTEDELIILDSWWRVIFAGPIRYEHNQFAWNVTLDLRVLP